MIVVVNVSQSWGLSAWHEWACGWNLSFAGSDCPLYSDGESIEGAGGGGTGMIEKNYY